MCGIAGFAGAGSVELLERMGSVLAHRGPDGQNVHHDAALGIGLVHRRLAVIDLATGDQPLWNGDRTVGVVFNGEIYNHVALRRELEALGHRFHTHHADSEVLVHGYLQWGDELPMRLDGMFAFVIVDARRRRLFGARDRFGEKPLYYASHAEGFVFGSELSAVALHPAVSAELDVVALQKYFAYGYIPAPHSALKGTSKLPAGHRFAYELDARRLRVEEYYRFAIEPDAALGARDESALAEELWQLIERSVASRLMSDVPIGCFLSGGIDSSAIVAAATRAIPASRLRAFSIGFREKSFDESGYAAVVARALGVRHEVELLALDSARQLAGDVLSRLDEPMADASLIPTYLLSRHARRHVTVALGGDGADELFAGYDPFKALAPARWYQRIVPRFMHAGLKHLASLLPVSPGNMSFGFKLNRTLRGLDHRAALWHPVWMSPLLPAEITELLDTPVSFETLYADAIEAWEGSRATDVVDRSLEFYTRFYLPNDILAKVDRASMMVSLETRAPFLANDLVEFTRRLPSHLKFRNGTTKYLLKRALATRLPAEIVHRRKKGFGIPLTSWLRDWSAPEPRHGGQRAADLAAQRWSMHRAGRSDERLFLWAWIVLQSRAPRTA